MSARCVAMCVVVWTAIVGVVGAEELASFESAVSTSTFTSGAFPATDALASGSGYWCSSGNHAAGERVTWIGAAAVAQTTIGATINWAYGPVEFRILTSADGGNFEEAAGWRAAARPEVSYVETVMFDNPHQVKALAVVMRSPKPWGFFGINDLSTLVQPGPSMLVAGSADGEERCLVADGERVGVLGCLDAIAGGSGAEVFAFNSASQLVSALSGLCVSVANGGLSMQDCEEAIDAGDGRSNFLLDASRVQSRTGYCLTAGGSGASVAPCSAVDQGEGIATVAVAGLDLAAAAPVKDAAALLRAAATRQSSLLGQLKSGLQACRGLVANGTLSRQDTLLNVVTQGASSATSDPASEASRRIDAAMSVDLAQVKALISESKSILAMV